MVARANSVSSADASSSDALLFDAVGAFLANQRLPPNPVNYAFAYHVVTEQGDALSREVARITDAGIRISGHDFDQLGVTIDRRPTNGVSTPHIASSRQHLDGLVAQTQMQVEGFADMVLAMRAETHDFGRDLAASADVLRISKDDRTDLDDVTAGLTATMLRRVHLAEARLEQATTEARELRSKLEEARDNASRDPLTGLPNRRAFEEAFGQRIDAGEAVILAVCDIDHFKAINDQFGHAVGDRVLKAIASTLASSCDGYLVARHGGEEFTVLLADISPEAALAIIEEARETVSRKRFRLRETEVLLGEITFSAGLSSRSADETLADMFGRADSLLYAAKNAGRNLIKTEW